MPVVWRPTLEAIVSAFVSGDFRPSDIPGLDPIDEKTAQQMQEYVADYGQVTLADLTDETWATSVARWRGDKWRTLVDLRTVEEGRSDLCLETDVREDNGGYRFTVLLVYVLGSSRLGYVPLSSFEIKQSMSRVSWNLGDDPG